MIRVSQGLVVAGLLLVGIGGTAWMLLNRPQAKARPPEEYIPLVRVHEVQFQSVNVPIYSRGTAAPGVTISLVAGVGGKVVSTAPQMTDGGFFKSGDLLFEIERRPHELEVTRARAAVENARLALAQAQAAARGNKGIEGLEQSPLARGEPQLRQAESAEEAALAGLELAQRQLDQTRVMAPFDGRVLRRLAAVGQYVAPGTPLAEVYGTDLVEVRLPVGDQQMGLLPELNQPALVQEAPSVELIDPRSEHVWPGTIVRAEGEVDLKNRLLYVVAVVQDPYGLRDPSLSKHPLMPGTFVEAKITGREYDNVAVLPRAAMEGDSTVWLVTDADQLEMRSVTTLYRGKEQIYVRGGLHNGDRVLLTKLDTRVEGLRVRVEAKDKESGGAKSVDSPVAAEPLPEAP